MKLRVAFGAATALSLSTPLQSPAAADPPAPVPAPANADSTVLNQSERAAKAAEEWELKGESAFGQDEDRATALQQAEKDLAAYLKAHPNDVRALLLQARVSRALIVVTPVAVKLDDQGGGQITSGDTSAQRQTALAAIDSVLKLQPRNAQAFYWKARTLNLSNPGAEQVGAEAASDTNSALAAARMAATLEPDSPTYREYLAMVLFGSGQRDEALAELRKLPSKHPILQLIDDQQAVSAPPGGKEDPERAYDMARTLFSGQMDVFKYAGLRPRVYRVAAAPSTVLAFYNKTWPTLHWVKDRESGSQSAAMVWHEDKLEPAPSPAPYLDDFGKRVPPSGILLLVARDEEAKTPQSTVYIVNFRRF